jgi:lipopolysaccharide export system permease protein
VRTLDRYILTEMILPFLCGLFAIIIMLVGNTIFPLIQTILKSNIPLGMVARLIIYNIPSLIVLTLPVGTAVSAAFAVNRLSRDSEITPIRMAGVPLARIFLPIFAIGFAVSAISFWLGDYVVPASERAFLRVQTDIFGEAVSNPGSVVANQVLTFEDYSLYVGSAAPEDAKHPHTLLARDVVIYRSPQGSDQFPWVITAKTATYDNGLWHLHDAMGRTFDNDGFTRHEFKAADESVDMRIPLPTFSPNESVGFAGLADNLSMSELAQQIDVLHKTGGDASTLSVDYQFKMALPFMCFAFALCAPPLALRFARAGSFTGVFLSIVMIFVAWNTIYVGEALGFSGKVTPIIAAWTPDVIFALLGIFMLRKAE